ncbi:MAG: DUF1853 family protein [Pseudomonadota bacterium]
MSREPSRNQTPTDKRSRNLRDLDWCLQIPPLMAKGHLVGDAPPQSSVDIIWPTSDWFGALTPSHAEPPSPPDPHRFRLGLHFEALIQHWLAGSDRYDLIKHNWQVIEAKQTIGEFDLIISDRLDGAIEHWELAVKFYLGTDDLAFDKWYGPNTNDRFDLKFDRLCRHQLTLATQPAPTRKLTEANITVDRVRSFMKGRLFYPRHQWERHEISRLFHPDHPTGWWLAVEDLPHTFGPDSRFVYLPKGLWLSPLTPGDIEAPLSTAEVRDMVTAPHAQQATHFAEVTHDGEISRGFVVSSTWLERVR